MRALLLCVFAIFGVSRETWWKAYLLMIAGVVGIGYLLVEIDKLI